MRDDDTLGDDLKQSAHKIWLAGLGALATAEEEGAKLFEDLVARGSAFEGRSRARVEEMRETVAGAADRAKESAERQKDRLEAAFEERLEATLGRLGVPSRAEIERLRRRVEELTETLRELELSRSATSEDPVDPTPGAPGSDPGPSGADG